MIMLPILTTSLIHFSSKGWENVLFELGSERVNRPLVDFFSGLKESRCKADEQIMVGLCLANLSATKNKLAIFTEQ